MADGSSPWEECDANAWQERKRVKSQEIRLWLYNPTAATRRLEKRTMVLMSEHQYRIVTHSNDPFNLLRKDTYAPMESSGVMS